MCSFHVWFGAFCSSNDICVVQNSYCDNPTSMSTPCLTKYCPSLLCSAALDCEVTRSAALSPSPFVAESWTPIWEALVGEWNPHLQNLIFSPMIGRTLHHCRNWGFILMFWRNYDFLKKSILGQFCYCSVICWKCSNVNSCADVWPRKLSFSWLLNWCGTIFPHSNNMPTGIYDQVPSLISVISSPSCQVKRQINHGLNKEASSYELRLWLLSNPMFQCYFFVSSSQTSLAFRNLSGSLTEVKFFPSWL